MVTFNYLQWDRIKTLGDGHLGMSVEYYYDYTIGGGILISFLCILAHLFKGCFNSVVNRAIFRDGHPKLYKMEKANSVETVLLLTGLFDYR